MAYEATRWWRVVGSDGKTWCETSSEGEARAAMRPGDTLQHLYQKVEYEWREEK